MSVELGLNAAWAELEQYGIQRPSHEELKAAYMSGTSIPIDSSVPDRWQRTDFELIPFPNTGEIGWRVRGMVEINHPSLPETNLYKNAKSFNIEYDPDRLDRSPHEIISWSQRAC